MTKIYKKKQLFAVIVFMLFLPILAFANDLADTVMTLILLLMFVGPFYVFASIPYFIQRRNNGKNIFLSILSYAFCIAGITLAYYLIYGFKAPILDFGVISGIFYLRILPFIVVVILTALKDYTYWKNKNIAN